MWWWSYTLVGRVGTLEHRKFTGEYVVVVVLYTIVGRVGTLEPRKFTGVYIVVVMLYTSG